jgi:ABC-type multidrug transport system fused ATPase/permease subunit
MHPPSEGRIFFDGMDLASLQLVPFRKQLGVVLQDSFLFDDTVRANLSLRDPDLPLARIRWAAEVAQIHGVIEALPQGYQTRLGENGRTLSGGERQRLCLARAIALEPAILLLDEATSALDLDTESRVHQGLTALGCTRILIAHRLDTVRDADRILVLDGGRLVDQGSFQELSERAGLFQELVQAMEGSRG